MRIAEKRWAVSERGAYKDYIIRQDSDGTGTNGTGYYFRSLNDVGGWAQLKQNWSERLQFNTAFGLDEVFARQLRRYAGLPSSTYLILARNRTYVENVIYSPSAYLLFLSSIDIFRVHR